MAPLIVEAARTARQQSRHIRAQSLGLRLAIHANVRLAEARRTRATEVAEARMRSRLAMPVPSPWSELRWRRDDEALHAVLIPLD